MQKHDFKPPVHGWLSLDKPLGLTSTQALGRARRLLGGKKVGHGGTLDPLATGVLPLAFGEATKLIPYVMDGEKEYAFSVAWGEARATDDAEGAVVARSPKRPSAEDVRAALPFFLGDILQKPPAFSAIKIDGERAYDLARAGELLDLPARDVFIDFFEMTDFVEGESASFRVGCGKGMYVRSLARDLAARLGTLGYVSCLRRTKVGPFMVENSVSIDELERLSAENDVSKALLPLKAALDDILVLSVTQIEANALQMGKKILIRPQHGEIYNESVVFTEYNGVPVALVEAVAGELRVLRGFHFG